MKNNVNKVIIFIVLVFLFIITISITFDKKNKNIENQKIFLSNYLSSDEINYIFNNNIDIEEVKPYLEFINFNIYNFYSYQQIKRDHNLNNLESINYYNNPNYYNFYSSPKKALFIDTPLTLVNKCFYLEEDFVPSNLIDIKQYKIDFIIRENEDIKLKKDVLDEYQVMYDDASKKNINLVIFSGYRSYNKQSSLYYDTYKEDDSISARPGFSEHQTGYAVDISIRTVGLEEDFQDTNTYKWLLDNSYKYGFILRFPDEKTYLTGYQFEPWHFRYVGDVASDIYYQNLTLEEYIFSSLEI